MIVRFERPDALLERVGYWASQTPSAPAVSVGGDTLSYAELWSAVRDRASGLHRSGVEPGDVLGMCLVRGVQPILTALSAWAVGATWTFLDADFPVARLQSIVDGAALGWLVSDGSVADLDRVTTLPLDSLDADGRRRPEYAIDSRLCPDAGLAYLIFTSGSTGVPKGVAVEHRNLRFFLEAFDETVLQSPTGAVWVAGAALSFDMCIPETIGALTCGGHVVVRRRLEALAPIVDRYAATHLQCTPTQLALFMADELEREALLTLRHVIVAGEPVPVRLAGEFRKVFDGRLTNAYGPTEITVYATAFEIVEPPNCRVPVGKAYPGIICALIDPETGQVLGEGQRGELVIAGPGVSRGYYRREDLTTPVFVDLPIGPGGEVVRAYRSGDSAEIDPTGVVTVFGRLDHQVKVRGQRVELGEVEAILMQHSAIRIAAVIVVRTSGGNNDARLVAHVVTHGGTDGTAAHVTAAELREFCHARLPQFMVPAFVEIHEALPYTATGKVDRNSLAARGLPVVSEHTQAVVARFPGADPRLAVMIRLWAETLGVGVAPDENFFHAGGHSLLGVELLMKVREHFGRRLALGSLVTAGTPRLMLAAVDADGSDHRCLQLLRSGTGPATVIIHGGGGYLLRLYALAQRVTPGQPVFGLQAFGLHPGEIVDRSVPEIAKRYLGELALEGLFGDALGVVIGYSGGGIIAAEMGAQLHDNGSPTPLIVALDTDLPGTAPMTRRGYWWNLLLNVLQGGPSVVGVWWRVRNSRAVEDLRRTGLREEAARHGYVDIQSHLESVLSAYRPRPVPANLGLVRVTEESPSERPDFGWARFVGGRFAQRTTKGDHFSILEEPRLDGLVDTITQLVVELSTGR